MKLHSIFSSLRNSNIFLSKSRGQNFLIDKNILRKIITISGINASDVVLEIGAGVGNLTVLLKDKAKYVFANEFDKKLLEILNSNTSLFSNVKVIAGDFLKINLSSLFGEIYPFCKVKIIANLPYNISTPILEKIFANRKYFTECVLMLQEEFARRLVAKPNTPAFGRLSLFAQYYTTPKILFKVKSASFFPPPQVESCLVQLLIKEDEYLNEKIEHLFFEIVKYCFQKRRKSIRNILSSFLGDRNKAENILALCNIAPTKRPENIRYEEYILISEEVAKIR